MSRDLNHLFKGLQDRYSREAVAMRDPVSTITVASGGRVYQIRQGNPDPDLDEGPFFIMTGGGDGGGCDEEFYYSVVDADLVMEVIDGIEADAAAADIAEEAAMEAGLRARDAAVRAFLAAMVRKAIEARPFDTDLGVSLGPVLDYLEPPQA